SHWNISFSILYDSLLLSFIFLFFFYGSLAPPDLHSFPTRRSSDLICRRSIGGRHKQKCRTFLWDAAFLATVHLKFRDLRPRAPRSEEHTSELQSLRHLVCRLLLEKKKNKDKIYNLTIILTDILQLT